MKIIKLQAENVKRLKAIDITPKGNIVEINGKNRQGKSSILDAITMALCGEKYIPKNPIHDGEDKAKIVIDMGEFTVTRSFTPSNSYLRVENKDGDKKTSPQKFLDDIVGSIAFDPMNFINADPDKQKAMLMELTGVNVDEFDLKRKNLFDERTAEGRVLKNMEAVFKTLEFKEGLVTEEVSTKKLMAEIFEVQEFNNNINTTESRITKGVGKIEDIEREVQKEEQAYEDRAKQLKIDLEAESIRIKKEIERLDELLQEKINNTAKQLNDTEVAVKEFVDVQLVDKKRCEVLLGGLRASIEGVKPKDDAPFHAQLETAEQTNKEIAENKRYTEKEAGIKTQSDIVDGLTNKINDIDRSKKEALQKANMPVEGLSFGVDGVSFNGHLLDSMASSDRITIGLAISMASNPKLRVLRITDGSLLDSESWNIIKAMAAKEDYQIWVERVAEEGKTGFFIEDGMVKS